MIIIETVLTMYFQHERGAMPTEDYVSHVQARVDTNSRIAASKGHRFSDYLAHFVDQLPEPTMMSSSIVSEANRLIVMCDTDAAGKALDGVLSAGPNLSRQDKFATGMARAFASVIKNSNKYTAHTYEYLKELYRESDGGKTLSPFQRVVFADALGELSPSVEDSLRWYLAADAEGSARWHGLRTCARFGAAEMFWASGKREESFSVLKSLVKDTYNLSSIAQAANYLAYMQTFGWTPPQWRLDYLDRGFKVLPMHVHIGFVPENVHRWRN